MRRHAATLVLVGAALASIATKRPLPEARVEGGTVLFAVDPAAPEPLTFQVEAAWSQAARRRAEIEWGHLEVHSGGSCRCPKR